MQPFGFSWVPFCMISHYLKTGFRYLLRNRLHTIINIGGLALGMATAVLIGLWVYDELTFNEYHSNHERLSKVYKWTGQEWLPYPLAVELKENYHQSFKSIAVTTPAYEHILSSDKEKAGVNGLFADPVFPGMLTLEMIEGSNDGLRDAHSILLSQSTAQLLFGDKSAVDQFIRMDNNLDVKVTGVYKDIPRSSSFNDLKFIAPWELYVIDNPWMQTGAGWDNHFIFVYTELADGVTYEQVAPLIADAEMKVIRNLDHMKEEAEGNPKVWLLPMDKWHLNRDGAMQFVSLVSAIGLFVLLLACINFMNLATASSEKRLREVGVRKAIGSLRSQLIGQFYGESFIVVFFALLISIVITAIALPSFNELSDKAIQLPFSNVTFWLSAIGLTTITAILAASYPAVYLSSFKPVLALKGKIVNGHSSLFRRMLITIQFTVSIILIISTIVVYKQITFARDREIGYKRDNLLMIRSWNLSRGRYMSSATFESLRNEIIRSGVAKEVSYAGGMVTEQWSQAGGFTWTGKDPDFQPTFGSMQIDHRFGKTVGWKIISGRDFEEGMAVDSSGLIINEAAAKAIGMIDPVGETIHWKSKWHFKDKDFKIIGIVGNLMMKSPYDKVMPAIFYLEPAISRIHVRLDDSIKIHDALSKIETAYRKIVPDLPFEYRFADDAYNAKFAYEERVGKLAGVFAVLAIAISCLGLFGMAVFMTERRTKEIGIRKVVGASVFRLWKMMSAEFVIIVAISFLLAVPLAWYALSSWIENFVYHTEISWEVFAVAGFGSLIVTLTTVSFQLLKAASRSPVHSLKTE
jgi:putative ABC transport system permease protein